MTGQGFDVKDGRRPEYGDHQQSGQPAVGSKKRGRGSVRQGTLRWGRRSSCTTMIP